jgi:hypothetical protein
MEPISFTLAVAGIPSVFKSCVDCYQYIQFGRAFAPTLSLALSQLEASEMRLTRWGAAMGIRDSESVLELPPQYSEEDIQTAYRWLQQIESAFGAAIETSSRYKGILKPEDLQILETESELEKTTRSFRSFHLSLKRINETRFKPRKRDRIGWALYKKTTFEELVGTLSILVNNLVELFPSNQSALQEMCRDEVKAMDADSLPILNAVSVEDDVLLPIVQEEMRHRGHRYEDVRIEGNAVAHLGDRIESAGQGEARSHVYVNIRAGGKSVSYLGNVVGSSKGFESLR